MEKPFALDHLRTTVRKTLEKHCPPTQIRVGELIIDLLARQVWRGEQVLALTVTEFEVLAYLARRSGQIVTFEELPASMGNCFWPARMSDGNWGGPCTTVPSRICWSSATG